MADLLSLDDAEYKMADLDRMKNHSKEMLMIFETHLTSYDPAVVDLDEWDYKTFCAWDDLDTYIEKMINRQSTQGMSLHLLDHRQNLGFLKSKESL